MIEEHDMEMHLEGNGVFRAWCSCGWSSRHTHFDQHDAIEDWENHCEDVFIRATMEQEEHG